MLEGYGVCMAEQIRVLHVLGSMNLGGAESRIMDLYRNMDREKVQFDFLVHDSREGFFDKEISELGGHIYHVPRFKVYNYFTYRKAMKQFFAVHHEFRAVHGHMTSTASLYLPIAKRAGITMTIAHARSAGVDKGLKGTITKWMRRPLSKRADHCLACSRLAGEAVFGEASMRAGKVRILPNAIETVKYEYNEAVREEMRKELGLQDKYIIGHVGRFHYAKNHDFLIDIFAEIRKRKGNAVLLLLGEGSLMAEVKEKVSMLDLEQSVIFAGNQSDVSKFYQAMDYLVFPSRFEGMPGTIVEAQAAGLPCLIADTISEEVKVTELVQFASLCDTPEEWADRVCGDGEIGWDGKDERAAKDDRTGESARKKAVVRSSRTEELVEAGFDVHTQVMWYERFYAHGI